MSELPLFLDRTSRSPSPRRVVLELVAPEAPPRRTGTRGAVAERIVELLEHLQRDGGGCRELLLEELGWRKWQVDRVVHTAKKRGLIDVENRLGEYNLTPQGRQLLTYDDPVAVIGPPRRRGRRQAVDGNAPSVSGGADDLLPLAPGSATAPGNRDPDADGSERPSSPAAPTAPLPAPPAGFEGTGLPESTVLHRRDQVRARVEEWASWLRPEVRARLVEGGHLERLVRHAWRCAGVAR